MPAFALAPRGANVVADHAHFRDSVLPSLFAAQPFCFVDVGARGGMHELVAPIARHTVAIAFEPDAEECRRLQARYAGDRDWGGLEFEPIALHSRSGEFTLHRLRVPTNDSLLPPNLPFVRRYRMEKFEPAGEMRVSARALDEVLAERRARGVAASPDMIKLDTQGSEYEILAGAARALREDAVAVVTEVSFCEVYAGQKLYADLDLLLRGAGFSFFGFDTFHQRSRSFLDKSTHVFRERAIFGDAVFFKDPLPGGRGGALPPRKLAALFVSAVLTGYFDYALELAAAGLDAPRLEPLVRALAAAPAAQARDAVRELAKAVEGSSERANLEVGRFVDERRHYCDYHDVFRVSSLPRDYS